MRQFLYCLNCVVAIILLINLARLSAAPCFNLPKRFRLPREAPRPLDVPDSELQFLLNAHLKTGLKLPSVEDWDYIKVALNIKHIIYLRLASDGEEEEKRALSFQAKYEERGFTVKLQKNPVTDDILQELCSPETSETPGRKLLIGFDVATLRCVYLEKVGCAVALRNTRFLEDFKLRSVPILTQAELETFITATTQEAGTRWHMARNLVEYLVKGGVKVVVVTFQDTVIPGNGLDKPFPNDFKKFAKVIHGKGLMLYIQSSVFGRLKRKFSKASIYAKVFPETDDFLAEVLEAKHPKEVVLIDYDINKVHKAVDHGYLAIHSAGENGFELGALEPSLPPPYTSHRQSDLHSLSEFSPLPPYSLSREPPPPYSLIPG